MTYTVSQQSKGSILMVQTQQPVQIVRSFAQGQWGRIKACVIFVQYGQLHYAQKDLVKGNVNRTHAVMNHISSASHIICFIPFKQLQQSWGHMPMLANKMDRRVQATPCRKSIWSSREHRTVRYKFIAKQIGSQMLGFFQLNLWWW